MSSASNLGYGGMAPYSNSTFINATSSNNPANFSSNEIPGLPGLAGAKSNIDAAAGKVPGICLFKGGAKKLKTKIKNITKRYKTMKRGSKRMRSLKSKIRSRGLNRSFSRRTRRNRHGRKQRGGYSQYMNNQPFSMGYSRGGVLSAADSALANPAPFTPYNNAVDNYNRYTNMGFPSKGH